MILTRNVFKNKKNNQISITLPKKSAPTKDFKKIKIKILEWE